MANTEEMIRAIARREGSAKELAARFGLPPAGLRAFTAEHIDAIKAVAAEDSRKPSEPTPADLDSLWITNKTERLRRLQAVADETYNVIQDGCESTAELAIVIREFRSYLMLAANELGQLLHRGSGDSGSGDFLSVEINGVDMGDLQ